jgi:hypothetical protein
MLVESAPLMDGTPKEEFFQVSCPKAHDLKRPLKDPPIHSRDQYMIPRLGRIGEKRLSDLEPR